MNYCVAVAINPDDAVVVSVHVASLAISCALLPYMMQRNLHDVIIDPCNVF